MEYYNKIGRYYDQDAVDFDARYWQNPVLQIIRQSFREEVKRHDFNTMFEVGFGTGLDLVHFGNTHPEVKIYGIDVSEEMVKLAGDKVSKSNIDNVIVKKGIVEEIEKIFEGKTFDMIYVFFGALNTVDDLKKVADILCRVLDKNGTMVLSFVNKWYFGGIILELLKFKFRNAFARLNKIWRGYSPVKFLPSHCYTPKQIKKSFSGMKAIKQTGYSIVHPAWYYIRINSKLGRLRKVLWKIDIWLNKTFLWRFGEYTLFVFKKSNVVI